MPAYIFAPPLEVFTMTGSLATEEPGSMLEASAGMK